jgi:hypothetical protein
MKSSGSGGIRGRRCPHRREGEQIRWDGINIDGVELESKRIEAGDRDQHWADGQRRLDTTRCGDGGGSTQREGRASAGGFTPMAAPGP